MQHLIDETDRRREIQEKYNKENNITPRSIVKSLDEIKQSTMVAKESDALESDFSLEEDNIDNVEINDLLEKLNRKMLNCAKKLHFEEAAILRDKINKIKEGIGNE